MTATRNDKLWPMQVRLRKEVREVGLWESENWEIEQILPYCDGEPGFTPLNLELHRDERTSYRFNLNSRDPRLFLLCQEDETDGSLSPLHLTVSQDEASSFMDGEHQVLSVSMPAAVQCWIDRYLGIHGELIDEGRKKKKRGKGRSSGK